VAPGYSSKRDTEGRTPHQEQPTQEWSEVRSSKAKTKTTGKPRDTPKTPERLLSDPIAVRPENSETYTDILKEIKQKVDIDAIGFQVASIRESRDGEILIRLKREDTKREELVEALKSKLGSHADIRGLVRYDDIEIQDLDSVTTDTEVETSIRNLLGLSPGDTSIKVKSQDTQRHDDHSKRAPRAIQQVHKILGSPHKQQMEVHRPCYDSCDQGRKRREETDTHYA